MNKLQVMTNVGTVLTAVGPVLTLTGVMTPDQWGDMSHSTTAVVDAGLTLFGAVSTAVGLLTTWWNTRKAAQVVGVQSIPGVQVHVDTSTDSPTPESVQALVKDKSVPDVVPMGPAGPVVVLK